MKKLSKEEKGLAVVEATILLPFCMVMILALFYAAIFMCQKANLQANVENTLLYYKNVHSDNYVEASSHMSYKSGAGTTEAVGSSYGKPVYRFPYRFLFMKFDREGFRSFFRSMCGHMFFDDGSEVSLDVDYNNYVIYKTITATARQTVRPAVSLAMIGLPDSMEITVSGTVVVTDGDDFIRNTDFVVDIVSHTALGQKASELVDRGKAFYERFKSRFHVSGEGC